MRKTLIIGNGFDLHCGLDSRYSDYFNNKFTEEITIFLDSLKEEFWQEISILTRRGLSSDTIFPHIYFLPVNKREEYENLFSIAPFDTTAPTPRGLESLSFWDLLFYFLKDEIPNEWNNIESRIKHFISDEILLNSCFRGNCDCNIYNLISSTFFGYFDNDRFLLFDDEISFLINELSILEKDFSKYLSQNLESKKNYISNSINLADKLLDIKGHSQSYYVNILNFNYTNPFHSKHIDKHYSKTGISYQSVYLSTKNIHGTLDSQDTIFGIDPKNVRTKDKSFLFTKTYRQLIGNISKNSNNLDFLPDNNEVIFYGHSLSSSDYSYFEAIFDKLNLYDSNTHLIFKYTPFDNTNAAQISLDYVDRITKLLEEYASTLSNKDHKENLVSRLLLENRITIQEVS